MVYGLSADDVRAFLMLVEVEMQRDLEWEPLGEMRGKGPLAIDA